MHTRATKTPLLPQSYTSKLTRNKNTRNIFPHNCFPLAIIGIICLYMHLYSIPYIRDQHFLNTYTTSCHMTNTAQNAIARDTKICLLHASFIYRTRVIRKPGGATKFKSSPYISDLPLDHRSNIAKTKK